MHTPASTCTYLICLGTFQDLIERVVSVTAADSILLEVTEVNISSNQDLKGILIIPRKTTHNTVITKTYRSHIR